MCPFRQVSETAETAESGSRPVGARCLLSARRVRTTAPTMADNPSEPATPMERMRTDRHIQEVDELCQRRRDEGRPWTARASPAGIPGSGKVVHFIRHGQAEHNALAAASGAPACHCKRSEPGGRDTPQASCPYNADAAFDAPLTATGRDQASDLADTCAGLGVQLVVSSPLRRTLQTALHAFGDFIEADLLAPVVAHEALREQHGMHRCDQRRDTVAIGAEFGVRVNVDGLPPTDTLWTDQRESKDHVADRCEEFATWLMEQPEDNIAVVAHHHVLLVLFHCVVECGDGGGYYEGLLKPFSVGEMRSLRVEIPTLEDQLALAEETAMAMDEEVRRNKTTTAPLFFSLF
jgi:broad specificity phosphatase PhoE